MNDTAPRPTDERDSGAPPPTGRGRRTSRRVGLAALGFGLVAGVAIPAPDASSPIAFKAVVGLAVAGTIFSIQLLGIVMRLDAAKTKAFVAGHAGSRSEVDLVVVLAGFAAVTTLVFLLLGGNLKTPGLRTLEAGLAVAVVAAAWVSLHATYTLRYARHWYNEEPGCIDFNMDAPPTFGDFAYIAFDLGMTFQISDTTIRTSACRRIVFWHTLLSYFFNTCIVATVISLVTSLASG